MSFPSGVKSNTRLHTVWISWWSWEATSTLHFTASSPLFSAAMDLVQWLRQFSKDPQEQYLRGFLGRMLFSGEEVHKPVIRGEVEHPVAHGLDQLVIVGSHQHVALHRL